MNHKLPGSIIVFLFTFLINGYRANGQEMDLSSFVDLVKENNIELKLGAAEKEVSSEETKIARSLLLPNISLAGHYQRDFTKNFLFFNDEFDGTTTSFRTNFNNTVDLNAIANQTIFDASAFATVKVAKLAEELSKLNYESISIELLIQASSLYWQALFVKESVEVLEENTLLAKEQADQVEKIYSNGVVSELQLQQARALYRKSLPILNNAKNQYKNLLNELKKLANIPIEEEIQLSDDLEDIGFGKMVSEMANKMEQQPQIMAIKKEIEIAERQVVGKKNYWLPKMDIVAGFNYNGQDDDFNLGNNENRLLFGQLRVSIPIFSGGSNSAEIAKAKIEKEAAELTLENQRQEFLKQLRIAENDYNNAIENIALHKETIALNEREIEIFQKKLSLGVVTPIEFKESRLRLIQSKLELLNGYLDLHVAKLQITRILGEDN